MSLSDCEKCWDTPCGCGHQGYVAVYPGSIALSDKLRKVSADNYDRIRRLLIRTLVEELEKCSTNG